MIAEELFLLTGSKTAAALFLAILVTVTALLPVALLPNPSMASLGTGKIIQLTYGHWSDFGPSFSPNGQEIAFVSNRTGSDQIWIMSAEDGSQQQAITSVSGEALQPAFNLRGDTISFLWRHQDFSDFCFVHLIPPFRGVSCATHDSHVGDKYSWSPNGKLVAYDNSTSIFLFDIETNQTISFSYKNGSAIEPTFDSTGSKLFFSGSIGTESAIWEANLDGSNTTRVSWTGYDVAPQVSAKGNTVMYLTNYSGVWEPWIFNANSHFPSMLFQIPPPPFYSFETPDLYPDSVPRFSPNSTNVLMIQDLGNGSSRLIVASLNYETYSLASGGTADVTPFSVVKGVPNSCIADAAWNPNGNSIVFVPCSYGLEKIYLLHLIASSFQSAYG